MISFSSGLTVSLSVSLSPTRLLPPFLPISFVSPSSRFLSLLLHSLSTLSFCPPLSPPLPLSLSVVRFLRTPPTDIADDVDIGGKEGKRVRSFHPMLRKGLCIKRGYINAV